jgi:hypothetical protein
MLKRMFFLAVGLLVIALTTDAGSQVVDPCLSEVSVSCPGVRLCACPSNDFENISDACDGGRIEIWVRDNTGAGISGIPTTDYWIDACDPALALCFKILNPVVADAVTDSGGYTTISGRIGGGGCVLTGGLYVAVQGNVITEGPLCNDATCLDIVVVSPDINGSCLVSIADLSIFCSSYNKSEGMVGYNDCCDFSDDGRCTLSDFAYFAEHYTH